MEYSKPEIVLAGEALVLVQGFPTRNSDTVGRSTQDGIAVGLDD